jgi:phage shock protein C
MAKRLYRSTNNKVVAGVCGGIAEYFDVDPVIIRIAAVLLFLTKGIGLLAYIIAVIIIPKDTALSNQAQSSAAPVSATTSRWGQVLPGVILIVIGGVLLVKELFWWYDWRITCALILMLSGVALIFWRSGSGFRSGGSSTSDPMQPHNGSVHS